MKLKIFRYDGTSEHRYDTFEFDPPEGMTVLSALFHVQERFDDSLSFRYSCRGAVCGSCAMLINRTPALACRTQLRGLPGPGEDSGHPPLSGSPPKGTPSGPQQVILNGSPVALIPHDRWDPAQEILIEPLPNLPVLKDLVVDMDPFFERYRAIEPHLMADHASLPPDGTERHMDHATVTALERYTNCVLCASCFAACPIPAEVPAFLGPAALARLYRFHLDPREKDPGYRLELGNTPSGWWACRFHTNCTRVCPKGVPPNLGIGDARKKLLNMGRGPKPHPQGKDGETKRKGGDIEPSGEDE